MFGSHILAWLVPGLHNVWCLFQDWGEMGHKHNLHFGWHTQRVNLSRTTGWVQLGFALKVVLCWGVAKKTGRVSQVMEVYSLFVGFVTQLYSPSNLCVCVCGVWTHCVYTQSSLSIFTMFNTPVRSSLHSGVHGCSAVKLTFYLHQTPSWLWLVTNGYLTCVHPPGYGRTYQSTQQYK